jgi:hypothetical protein
MSKSHTCKNCGNGFNGKFCNLCGEKVYTEKDKSIKHIIGEGLHFITHFEGNFFNTLKAIFTAPGKFSLDYCNGIRKKYFKPLSFFLMLVILYLLFPVFEGLNMKLEFHKTHNLYGGYATQVVENLLKERNITELQLANSFHNAGEKTSKFLLFIIIPFVALASWIMCLRKSYYHHFVFTIEASSFFILWGFLLLPLLLLLVNLTTGFYFTNEGQVSMTILGVFIIFITIAAKRFFCFKWWYSILYSILFTVSLFVFLEYVYKFILFLIAIRLA